MGYERPFDVPDRRRITYSGAVLYGVCVAGRYDGDDEMMEKVLGFFKKHEKKYKLKGLDKYVIFSISLLIIYTIAEFVTATVTGVEKSTLTLAVFGFFGAPELVGCALIKIFKLKRGESE